MTIYPNLGYRDAHAAIRFLVEAFGFRQAHVYEDAEGKVVAHAKLDWPSGGSVTVYTATADGASVASVAEAVAGRDGYPPYSIHVDTDDPDAVYARAVAAGAAIVRDVKDSPHGTRGFIARDPEGLYWSFGTPLPEPEA